MGKKYMFMKRMIRNDTGMDPENAFTAIEPEEARWGSVALAAGAASAEGGSGKTAEG